MMTEMMQRNSVQKLKGLLHDRYGMGLQITAMISVTDMDVRHVNSELRGSSLHVPVCARGKYLATAILSRANSLSEGDISAVSEMIRLVLEPALFSVYLERQESNVSVQDLENVIPMPFLSREEFLPDASDWNNEGSEWNASIILLESYNPHTISRVAVHIHETGERWAMLRYQDIRDSLSSIQDLREMGPMTLLVEDILHLSPEEQRRLVEFADTSDPKTEPLILIGCTSPLDDLVRREIVVPALAGIVEKSRLELDRMPQEFSKLRETIEMALDKHSFL